MKEKIAGIFIPLVCLLIPAGSVQAGEFYCYTQDYVTDIMSHPKLSVYNSNAPRELYEVVAEELRKQKGVTAKVDIRCRGDAGPYSDINANFAKFYNADHGDKERISFDFSKVRYMHAYCRAQVERSINDWDVYSTRPFQVPSWESAHEINKRFITHIRAIEPEINAEIEDPTCEVFGLESLASAAKAGWEGRSRVKNVVAVKFDMKSPPLAANQQPATPGKGVKSPDLYLEVAPTGSRADRAGDAERRGRQLVQEAQAKRQASAAANAKTQDQARQDARRKREEEALIKCHGSLAKAERANASCQ